MGDGEEQRSGGLLKLIEGYCTQLYSAASSETREMASKHLEQLVPSYTQGSPQHVSEPLSSIQLSLQVLETSECSYALLFACQRIRSLAISFFAGFETEAMLHLRDRILNVLASRPNFPTFVTLALSQLFATVTKLGWFENIGFQRINEDVAKFLESEIHYQTIGLQLLATLIEELSQPMPAGLVRNAVKERKLVTEFKETQLLDTFVMALDNLKRLLNNNLHSNYNETSGKYIEALLSLLKNIVSFDFIGTNSDESEDDKGSSQFPASWKPILSHPDFIQHFFRCYRELSAPLSTKALSCLVHIAATRRSLFYEDEGRDFALRMINELCEVLASGHGLDVPENHHELCRTLARFRSTYQLSNIADTEDYWKWIKALTDFTIMTLETWEVFPNSVPYLMTVWVKIVASSWNLSQGQNETQMGASELHVVPSQIFSAFLNTRLDQVKLLIQGESFYEDMLENPDLLVESLEPLAIIARYRYNLSSDLLLNAYQDVIQEYEIALSETGRGTISPALSICEGKLTWIVYTIGALLAGRISYQSLDEDDLVDAELSTKVFNILEPNHTLLVQLGRSVVSTQTTQLNLAILYFFEQFQNSYVGDLSYRTTLVYSRMSEISSLSSASSVLLCIIQRILLNLQEIWTDDTRLITKSIGLLYSIGSSYNAVRELRKLDQVEKLLAHHGPHNFSFMLRPANLSHRASFYDALARLLYTSLDLPRSLARFVESFNTAFLNISSLSDPSQYFQDTVKLAISGLARDLQGVFKAAATRKSFMEVFGWFSPQHSMKLVTACQIYAESSEPDNDVGLPLVSLLKFYSELVMNRSQRLNFPISSATGLVLFRQVSSVLCSVGHRLQKILVSGVIPSSSVKLVLLWFRVIARILGGGYVCFGALQLYEDPALENLYQAYFRILTSLSREEVHAYPKLRKIYFELLELFITEHLSFAPNIPKPVFMVINLILVDGTQLLGEPAISSMACKTLDHIVTQLCLARDNQETANHSKLMHLVQLYSTHDELLSYLFSHLFSALLFGNVSNVWSYSRPLMAFIVYNRSFLVQFSQELLERQLESCKPQLEQALSGLLDGIGDSLESTQRDIFTQRLTALFRELHSSDLTLIPLPNEPLFLLMNMSLDS